MKSLLAVFFIGSAMATGGAFDHQDSWFCIICGFLLAFPLFALYSAVVNLYPGRNYYDNIIKACGGIVGRVLVLILSLYALLFGAFILRQETEFIRIVNLTETPLLPVLTAMTGTAIYLLRNRLHVIARVSKFLLPVIVGVSGLTVIFSIKDWDFSHLKPFLNTGFPSIAGGSLLILSLPFGEASVCASMFGLLEKNAKPFPILLKGALIGFAVLLWSNLRNFLVLGYSASIKTFPSYSAVSTVALGEFFTRIEVLIGIVLLLGGIIKVCVMLFCFASGFAKVFSLKDYEPLGAACGVLLLTTALFAETSSQDIVLLPNYIPWIALPIQILVPLAALTVGKLRNRRNPKKQKRKLPRTAPERPTA